jgi:hypothetical protein
MPHWHATTSGRNLHLVHTQPDEAGDVWSGVIEIWKGAPSWDSHPELQHAALGVADPLPHAEFIRHTWTYDLPDRWEGAWNCGDTREWMTLHGEGHLYGWDLVLRFPRLTPAFVFAAIARGFGAELAPLAAKPVVNIEFTMEPGGGLEMTVLPLPGGDTDHEEPEPDRRESLEVLPAQPPPGGPAGDLPPVLDPGVYDGLQVGGAGAGDGPPEAAGGEGLHGARGASSVKRPARRKKTTSRRVVPSRRIAQRIALE